MNNTNAYELLTSQEVATILRLKNHRTLAVWRSTKRYPLPYVKYGRAVRYLRKDVEEFLEKHTMTSTDITHKSHALITELR